MFVRSFIHSFVIFFSWTFQGIHEHIHTHKYIIERSDATGAFFSFLLFLFSSSPDSSNPPGVNLAKKGRWKMASERHGWTRMTVIIHDGFRPLQRRVPSGTRRGLSCEGQINGSGNADSPSGEISPEGFLFNRKLCSLLNKNAPRDAHSCESEICRWHDRTRRESSASGTLCYTLEFN